MMDTGRIKRAAEWFYSTVFQEESIRQKPQAPAVRIPAAIRAARSLENGTGPAWQSRESVFVKQGKVLAGYEDDYIFEGTLVRYFPTYGSLSDAELRGYFSWRTKLRRGQIQKTSLTFAFLYIYELLNQIGVESPMDGYRKLQDFRAAYGPLDAGILPYLDGWLADYVVYYRLDPALLSDTPQARFDESLAVLAALEQHDDAAVMDAVKVLAPRWLERSKFYCQHRQEMEILIPRVLRNVAAHCARRCKKTMVEQYFGPYGKFPVRLFDSAVFCDQQKGRSFEYRASAVRIYTCQNGLWTVGKYGCSQRPSEKLNDLVKTVDAVLRQCTGYRYPIKQALDTKWLVKCIQEQWAAYQAEKQAAEGRNVTIDLTRLDRIRSDAALTRDKLIVDEERMEDTPPEEPEVLEVPEPPPTDTPLDKPEYRLLQCLLYGRDCRWVQSEGYLLSVLVDSINEKLYDMFLDTVLDSTPAPLDDYMEDLKEMIHPCKYPEESHRP